MRCKHRAATTLLGALAAALFSVSSHAQAEGVTYARDIAPILQSNCQECHRPGEAVPMTLMSYEEVRPWAKKIRSVVVNREMPPWHAHPAIGEFSNERTMTRTEIDKVAAWVDQGAPLGDPANLPEPAEFAQGWKIGKPDVVFEMPRPVQLEADLVDEYKYVAIPTDFKQDRWIEAAECRPGNPEVVHHIIAFVQEPDSGGRGNLGGSLGGYAPGLQPRTLPPGQAMLLPAGATIVLQMHYNKEAGVEATDSSTVGIRFARHRVNKRLRLDATGDRRFVIPPGAPNHEVTAVNELDEDIHMLSITPHMHLRGKDMLVWAELPDGFIKQLVYVPDYDFNFQTSYRFEEPVSLPAGTEIHVKAHFDNSADNPYNPDPTAAVRWGLPTHAEMMFAFYACTVDEESLNEVDPMARELAGGKSSASGGG